MQSVVESNGSDELYVEKRVFRPLNTKILVVLLVVVVNESWTDCFKSCVVNVVECLVNPLNGMEVL
jgi:hypothetical protein